MLFRLFDEPLVLVALALALIVGITVHEFAHAWVANLLGDPTARYQGRVSLNPLAHLDPLGTLFLFLAGFGWGKPVPVNPQYFTRPVVDELLVALAGPASNFLTAVALGGLLQVLGLPAIVAGVLLATLQINLMLMLFNLLPIPPLDGSKVLQLFLPTEVYQRLQLASLPLLFLLLIMLQSSGFGEWLSSTVSSLTRFLLGA